MPRRCKICGLPPPCWSTKCAEDALERAQAAARKKEPPPSSAFIETGTTPRFSMVGKRLPTVLTFIGKVLEEAERMESIKDRVRVKARADRPPSPREKRDEDAAKAEQGEAPREGERGAKEDGGGSRVDREEAKEGPRDGTARIRDAYPRIHPREVIVNRAKNALNLLILDFERDHDELTEAEVMSVIGGELASFIKGIAKYAIRIERHGDPRKPGGLA